MDFVKVIQFFEFPAPQINVVTQHGEEHRRNDDDMSQRSPQEF